VEYVSAIALVAPMLRAWCVCDRIGSTNDVVEYVSVIGLVAPMLRDWQWWVVGVMCSLKLMKCSRGCGGCFGTLLFDSFVGMGTLSLRFTQASLDANGDERIVSFQAKCWRSKSYHPIEEQIMSSNPVIPAK
jgi:hypothetical protein